MALNTMEKIYLAMRDERPAIEIDEALRLAAGMPVGLPATGWMLEVGAMFLRTETELILKSRRVVPTRLLESGYRLVANVSGVPIYRRR